MKNLKNKFDHCILGYDAETNEPVYHKGLLAKAKKHKVHSTDEHFNFLK